MFTPADLAQRLIISLSVARSLCREYRSVYPVSWARPARAAVELLLKEVAQVEIAFAFSIGFLKVLWLHEQMSLEQRAWLTSSPGRSARTTGQDGSGAVWTGQHRDGPP